MIQSFLRRWFLLALVAINLICFSFPHELETIAASIPRNTIVAGVLFLMALPLEISAIWQAMRKPTPVLLAVAINFGVLPLIAWSIIQITPSSLLPKELAIGLLVMAAIPTTLASAAVWTRRAGGNDAVSILATLVSNLSCFLVTPFLLNLTTGAQTEIDTASMIWRLAFLVVTPIVLAQLVRLWRPAASFAKARKPALGVVCQLGILSMVFVGVVRSGVQLHDSPHAILPSAWIVLLLAVAVVHLSTLWLGHATGRVLGIAREDRIAVGFSGSQKTLMVGLLISLQYYSDMPLSILPMVVYHVAQLLIDTLVADSLREGGPKGDRFEDQARDTP